MSDDAQAQQAKADEAAAKEAAKQAKADQKAADKAAKLAAAQAKADAKAAAKQAKDDEKAAAKQAKADEKAAAKESKEAEKEAKRAEKDAPAESPGTVSDRWERYNQLRANVRRRRTAYGLMIFLAFVTLFATLWDIVYNASDLKWPLLAIYAVLILWGVILLFSRRRHLQEVAELEAMQRTYLECDHCKGVFQFGQLRLKDRKKVGFSCPVCGDDSLLPGPESPAVERILPDAAVIETEYACRNCNEQIVVGTFGGRPRAAAFHACPSCGVAGKVAPT